MLDNYPKITVIIPSYNSGKFLNKAVESVVNQTYKNIEIIVINDGSTDNTEQIIQEWQQKDERVKYISHTKNKGLPAARNTAIRNSRGEYIALLDADDIWIENKLEKQLAEIRKGTDVVYSNAILINKRGEDLKKTLWQRVGINPCAGKDCLRLLFQKNFMIPASSLFFKKKILEEVEGFDEKLKSVEDYDFCLRILAKRYTPNYINSPLLFYRLGQQQMSSKEAKMEFWRVYVLLKFIFTHPLFLLKNPFLVIKRVFTRKFILLIKILRLYRAKR